MTKLFRHLPEMWRHNQFMIFRYNWFCFARTGARCQHGGHRHNCQQYQYFFHFLPLYLCLCISMARIKSRAICLFSFYRGILTASTIWAINSDNGIVSCLSTPKRRNVTVLSAASFSPTTAIIGVFATDNSRIL